MKAVGMKPQSRVAKLSSRVAWHVFDRRRRQIQATASGF
jgi:hypothetical protein